MTDQHPTQSNELADLMGSDGINNARLEAAQAGGDVSLLYEAVQDVRNAVQALRTAEAAHHGLNFQTEIGHLGSIARSLNAAKRSLILAKKTGAA